MELLAAFECMSDRIDTIIRQTDAWQIRAPQLAGMLRCIRPSFPLYACYLQANDGSHCCVLDQNGKPHDAWAKSLRPCLERAGGDRGKPASSCKLPTALKLSGYSLLSRTITAVPEPDVPARPSLARQVSLADPIQHQPDALARAGHPAKDDWGVLALAVPKNASPETWAEVGALLAVCCAQLALRFQAEALTNHLQDLQRELEGQSALASTGELAGPLTHEFNNFLNIVLLHVVLLETEIPEKLRSELIELRRQGATMTGLVKQFHQYRRRLRSPATPADVNRIVREAAGTLTSPQSGPEQSLVIRPPPSSQIEITGLAPPAGVPLNLVLAADLPPVFGSPADLKRLCTFLLTNAAAAAGSVGGSVSIRTESTEKHVLLRVEDTGPSVSTDSLPQVFEPTTAGRPGTNSLELAACATIVRRLQGRIRSENRPEGGVVVSVELPRTAP